MITPIKVLLVIGLIPLSLFSPVLAVLMVLLLFAAESTNKN